MGVWFDYVRIAGAIYLVWLGWKLLRANAGFGQVGTTPKPRGGFFLQGFLVLMSNPKALLWFGAFIPQFVDPAGNYVGQIVLLGATAMVNRGDHRRRLCGAWRPHAPGDVGESHQARIAA